VIRRGKAEKAGFRRPLSLRIRDSLSLHPYLSPPSPNELSVAALPGRTVREFDVLLQERGAGRLWFDRPVRGASRPAYQNRRGGLSTGVTIHRRLHRHYGRTRPGGPTPKRRPLMIARDELGRIFKERTGATFFYLLFLPRVVLAVSWTKWRGLFVGRTTVEKPTTTPFSMRWRAPRGRHRFFFSWDEIQNRRGNHAARGSRPLSPRGHSAHERCWRDIGNFRAKNNAGVFLQVGGPTRHSSPKKAWGAGNQGAGARSASALSGPHALSYILGGTHGSWRPPPVARTAGVKFWESWRRLPGSRFNGTVSRADQRAQTITPICGHGLFAHVVETSCARGFRRCLVAIEGFGTPRVPPRSPQMGGPAARGRPIEIGQYVAES